MKWLKENVGKETITEMSASDKLDEFRAEMGGFIRPSFGPISAFGEHSAIVHYSSSPETNVELHEGTFLMTDTGADSTKDLLISPEHMLLEKFHRS